MEKKIFDIASSVLLLGNKKVIWWQKKPTTFHYRLDKQLKMKEYFGFHVLTQ